MMQITTPYGDRYLINQSNGDITRTDISGFKPSGQWRMLGIEHVNRRDFIPLKLLTPANVKKLTLLYKNGYPQYTVRDWDHGTVRVWGNTHYHGIKSITFPKKR
jgi:hypothetical protein